MGEHLVHGEVEALVAPLHLGAVERAPAALDAHASARRALACRVLDAFLEDEALDPPVRGGLERHLPPRRGAAVPAGLLAPALDDLLLAAFPPAVQHRLRELVELARRRMGPRRRPADDRPARVAGEKIAEIALHLLGADDHDRRKPKLSEAAV